MNVLIVTSNQGSCDAEVPDVVVSELSLREGLPGCKRCNKLAGSHCEAFLSVHVWYGACQALMRSVGQKRWVTLWLLPKKWFQANSCALSSTCSNTNSPVCTFSRPHTSWRRTALWGRFLALWWWRKRRWPGRPAAPPPSPQARRAARSRGSTCPDAEPSENRKEAAPGWRSSAHRAQGTPYPAPPTSPEYTGGKNRRETSFYDATLCVLIKQLKHQC